MQPWYGSPRNLGIHTTRELPGSKESSPRARLYRRWHGCGLLGLSSLGLLVLLNGKVHDSSTWLSCSWKPFLELYWVQKSLRIAFEVGDSTYKHFCCIMLYYINMSSKRYHFHGVPMRVTSAILW